MSFRGESIGIPVPLKSWYRAFAYRCTLCGALVIDADKYLHEKWHADA